MESMEQVVTLQHSEVGTLLSRLIPLSSPVSCSAGSVLVSAIVCLIVTLLWKRSQSPPNIPGPWSLPLLGNLPYLGTQPHEGLRRLRERFGDVFKVYIGTLPVVVVSGLDTVKRALVDQAEVFSGRPELFTFQYTSEGKTMCFNSYSERWKIHRRLAERALKMVAGGTTFMDSIVKREAEYLSDDLLATGGQTPIDPMEKLLWAVAHVKYSLCYGDSREAEKDFSKMIQQTLKLIGCHNNGNLINFFPWTRHFMRRHFRDLKDVCSTMLNISCKKEMEHLDTYQAGRVRDALDALIQLGVETKCPLEQDRVLHTVQEFIGAGLDIVYCSLAWALLYMAEYPDIQRRLQEELDNVTGDAAPCMEDRERLPYWQAFILEVLRYSSVIPFALPHSTLKDTELNGYSIPSNTFILVSLFSISRDPKLWANPDVFEPERFLSADGLSVDTSLAERYIPFGVGKRRCVGEAFARNEIFLFLANIVHRCHVEKPAGQTNYDLRPEFGVIFRPKQFHVRFAKRR